MFIRANASYFAQSVVNAVAAAFRVLAPFASPSFGERTVPQPSALGSRLRSCSVLYTRIPRVLSELTPRGTNCMHRWHLVIFAPRNPTFVLPWTGAAVPLQFHLPPPGPGHVSPTQLTPAPELNQAAVTSSLPIGVALHAQQ